MRTEKRGLTIQITPEGKEMINKIIIGCVKVVVTTIISKETSELILMKK